MPASAATYEPKRLRLRILAVARRIVHTARRRILHNSTKPPAQQQRSCTTAEAGSGTAER